MTEYTKFMEFLRLSPPDKWVQLELVNRLFPGITMKTIDRLRFNHRLELQDVPEEGTCIRLTTKGREKQEKKSTPQKNTLLGISIMVLVILVFKVLPRLNVDLGNSYRPTYQENRRLLLDSILGPNGTLKMKTDSEGNMHMYIDSTQVDSL